MSDEENAILYYEYRRRRNTRKYWVHPYLKTKKRLFDAAEVLSSESDRKFLAFYRMSKATFNKLYKLVGPKIQKMDTKLRKCVSGKERLLITLRYLGTGETFVALSLYFARGESTVRKIIKETTEAIWNALHEIYMPIPTQDKLKHIAGRFELLWNLPNCIGALDGKHIRIEKFPHTGSENFNYKHFHSTVLMACCDADGLFTIIEPGYAGRNSDGGIFKASAMNNWISQDDVIPPPSPLSYDDSKTPFPYYFAADEAFPLTRNLMRPFPSQAIDKVKRIFNYRLSRGRKTIECVFGMAAEKFAVLNGPIRCHDSFTVSKIVKAACILHNFVRKLEGTEYSPTDFNPAAAEGAIIQPTQMMTINRNSSPTALRNYLANYFLLPAASVPWQWNA